MAAPALTPLAAHSARQPPARRGGLSAVLAFLTVVCLLALAASAASAFVAAPARTTSACRRSAVDRQAPKVSLAAKTREECKAEEENPMNKIKELGIAGIISYALWEGAFWLIGGGGAVAAYIWANGHLPDLGNQDEAAKVGGGAFVFINGARFLVPLRIGLAVSTTPWIDNNVVKPYITKDEECEIYDEDLEAAPAGSKQKESAKQTVTN